MSIVIFSPYPVSQPRHGGQRRVAAIQKQVQLAGLEVESIPIFFRRLYYAAQPEEMGMALSSEILDALHAKGWREDLHLSRVLGPEHPVMQALLARLRRLAPRVLVFEQPWLFELIEPLLDSDPVLAGAHLVYSAQNVETNLMDPVWQAETRALEQRLVQRAELVVAVCAADAAIFDSWRRPGQRPSLVAPNGCWAPAPDLAPPRPLKEEFAMLAGSAHPPNAAGYWECIGTIPGFMPPETRLAVVGEVGLLLSADPRFQQFRQLNSDLVHHAGSVSEERLTAYLYHSRLICLPITSGGGTNLKTAEALMWLKPVVAMRKALRGYEEAEGLSGVYIAETPQQFRSLMGRVMRGELTSARQMQDVARYGWPEQLAPMVSALEVLAGQQK